MTIPDSSFLMDNEEASCLPCTPEEEKRIIDELTRAFDSNRKEGDLFYVLSNKWYIEWQNYVGQDKDDFSIDEYPTTNSPHSNGVLSNLVAQRPGAIDNFHLVLNGTIHSNGDELELIRNLEEGRDYVLVSEEVWKKYHHWYTLNIWDVGGQKTIRSYWRNYFEQTDGLVWVVDSSDTRRLEDCKMELHNLLKEERLS